MSILFALLFLVIGNSGATVSPPVQIRELVCRGKPGIDLRIYQRPSPHDPRYVRMELKYGKSPQPIGENFEHLQPGTCTWNPWNFKDVPAETGVVHFDILPLSQPWFETATRQMDTTVDAAAFFPDTISLPRYLGRSDRYWKFFIDDQTNFSISFGAYRNPGTAPKYVTITGPYPPAPKVGTREPGNPSQPTTRSQPGAGVGKPRTPGTQTAAAATLAKLNFKGLDRVPNGFAVRFTARPNASVSVSYSTEKPVKTPGGWYFGGAAVSGSGAVSRGGFNADLSTTKSGSVFSEYQGKSRLPLQRATPYWFIITVEGGGPLEQYVGQFTSMQQDISVTLSSFTILKKSFDQEVDKGVQVFRNDPRGFQFCGSYSCDNAPDVVGLLVYAGPTFGANRAAPPTSWTVVSGKNSGVGKLTIDTRTISGNRPFRPFTIKSMAGDVEFEAIGELSVKWR